LKRYPKPHHDYQAVHQKKDLGQHFLYDTQLLRTLIEKAGVTGEDRVLEIGAGAGTLTRVLCETASQVIAVEVDEALLPMLRKMEEEFGNLTVIRQDIRKVDLRSLPLGEGFIVVANIPYSITSQIFDLFWGKGYPIRQMSVMVQKEVADKLTAAPGDKAFGLMSVRCGYYCAAQIIAQVPASVFTPPPNVDSAFVKLTFRKSPPEPVLDEQLLWRLVKASYRQRRKTLLNALKTVLPVPADALKEILRSMNLSLTVRGEALSVEQWIALSNAVSLKSRPSPASKSR